MKQKIISSMCIVKEANSIVDFAKKNLAPVVCELTINSSKMLDDDYLNVISLILSGDLFDMCIYAYCCSGFGGITVTTKLDFSNTKAYSCDRSNIIDIIKQILCEL